MKTIKLNYEIVSRDGLGMMVIKSGDVTIKTIKRQAKYDGYSGYDAYLYGERFPVASSSKFSALLRKLEKIEGVELKD